MSSGTATAATTTPAVVSRRCGRIRCTAASCTSRPYSLIWSGRYSSSSMGARVLGPSGRAHYRCAMSYRAVRSAELPPGEEPTVRELVEVAAERDGFTALNEAALLALGPPPADGPELVHVRLTADDRLIGYGQLLGSTGSLVVHPDHRRRGAGSALLAELLAARPADQGDPVAFWATRDTA